MCLCVHAGTPGCPCLTNLAEMDSLDSIISRVPSSYVTRSWTGMLESVFSALKVEKSLSKAVEYLRQVETTTCVHNIGLDTVQVKK